MEDQEEYLENVSDEDEIYQSKNFYENNFDEELIKAIKVNPRIYNPIERKEQECSVAIAWNDVASRTNQPGKLNFII